MSEVEKKRKLVQLLSDGWALIGWRALIGAMAVLGTSFAGLIYFEANAFVAKTPAVVAIATKAQEAKDVSLSNTAAIAKVDDKANQSLALSGKIFAAIKEIHTDIGSMKLDSVKSSAVLSTQVADLGARLTRIEQKQDAAK